MQIKAHIYTESPDGKELDFDCLPFFESASPGEIYQLLNNGLNQGASTYIMLEFLAASNAKLKDLYSGLSETETVQGSGFQTIIDKPKVLSFLRQNRPEIDLKMAAHDCGLGLCSECELYFDGSDMVAAKAPGSRVCLECRGRI